MPKRPKAKSRRSDTPITTRARQRGDSSRTDDKVKSKRPNAHGVYFVVREAKIVHVDHPLIAPAFPAGWPRSSEDRVTLEFLPSREVEVGTLDIDWHKLAECIVSPIKDVLRPFALRAGIPVGLEDADIERLYTAALAYVSARVEQEGSRFIGDALDVLEKKLRGEAVSHAIRTDLGDTALTREILRDHKHSSRESVTSLVSRWIPLNVGRPLARSDKEQEELRRKLQDEIPRRRALRIQKHLPSAVGDVLEEIAEEWGMSRGSLDHILRPRKSGKAKRSRQE